MPNANCAPSGFGGAAGLKLKLKDSIASMIQCSNELRQAIVDRDPAAVWRILAVQEERFGELERHASLWSQLFGDKRDDKDDTMAPEREEIRRDLRELRRVGDGNATIARNFLGAVGKALAVVGAVERENHPAKNKIYGKSGKMSSQKSFLFKQVG